MEKLFYIDSYIKNFTAEIKEIKEFMTWCQQGPSINEKRRKMRIDKVNFIVTTTKAMG